MQQRQIKFRALTEQGTEWFFWDVKSMIGPHDIRGDIRWNTLGQFTGLLDKNGKEIWEGDILGYPNPRVREMVKFGGFDNGGHYEEKESGVGFYRESRALGICTLTPDDGPRLEVIGNIHENPDLIESGNTTKEE